MNFGQGEVVLVLNNFHDSTGSAAAVDRIDDLTSVPGDSSTTILVQVNLRDFCLIYWTELKQVDALQSTNKSILSVEVAANLSAVDSALAAVHPVVDQHHVDLIVSLKVHLPPIVSVMPAVGRGSSTISSVDITVNSSLWDTAPSNRVLFSGSSLRKQRHSRYFLGAT